MPVEPSTARAFAAFEPMSDYELSIAARALDEIALAPGDALYRQREEGTSAYVVISGELEVRSAGHGEGADHMSVQTGTVLGQIGLLIDSARPATVVAVGHAKLLEITREAFQTALDRRDAWAAFFLQAAATGLAKRLEAVTAQLVSALEPRPSQSAAQVAELDRLRRHLSGIWSF